MTQLFISCVFLPAPTLNSRLQRRLADITGIVSTEGNVFGGLFVLLLWFGLFGLFGYGFSPLASFALS